MSQHECVIISRRDTKTKLASILFTNAAWTAHAHQNFVHSLGSEGALDEVADGHGADEGGETRSLRPLLVRVMLHDPDGVEGDHLDAGCLGRSEKFVEIR